LAESGPRRTPASSLLGGRYGSSSSASSTPAPEDDEAANRVGEVLCLVGGLIAAELAGKVPLASSDDSAAGRHEEGSPNRGDLSQETSIGTSKLSQMRRKAMFAELPPAPLPMSHIAMLKQLLGGDTACRSLYNHHCKAPNDP